MPQLLYNTDTPEFTSLDFKEVVLNAARSGELRSYAFILPTARKLREVERELTAEHHRVEFGPIIGIPIYTFPSFADALYRTLAPTRREISSAMQVALMERAMRSIDLDYYGGGERGPSAGVVEQIARVINGVRSDGIMPSDFARDLELIEEHPDRTQDYDAVKLRDLYNIYSEYLRLLSDRWVDYPGKMLSVNTELFQDRDRVFTRAFSGTTRILIYGFTEFTQPEIAMIQQLGYVTDLSVSIYFDYARENGPLYGNFDEAIDKLSTAGFRSIDLDPLEADIPEEERRPFRHHMRRNLFRTDDRIMNGSFDDSINVFGFFNRDEEAQGVAAYIKSLVIDEGYRPEDICVAVYDMNRYATMFREQLASHGIPSNITAQFALEQNALATALMSAFAILTGDFDRRDVLRAITSPYLNFGDDVDAAALTETSTRLRILRGRRFWAGRIERRIAFLRSRALRLADEDEQRSIELELEVLARAERSIHAIERMLDEFNHPMTPSEFRAAFLKLIARLRVSEQTLSLRGALESRPRTPQDWQRIHDEIERDTRAMAALLRLLDELTEFYEIEQKQNPEEGSDGRRPLDFYLDGLRTGATRSLYQIREKHDYGVLVTSLRQLPGLEFRVMIICGLVDGELPSTYVPENFLGKPLPNAEKRQLRRERIEFYSAVTQFLERLVMTYPRFAGETELVRSSFLDAFIRITTVEETKRVVVLDELRVVRDRIRRGEEISPHVEFLKLITTRETMAEEVGSALWSNQPVERVDVGEELVTHLRHTVQVEQERRRAKEGDESQAREYRGIITEALSAEELERLAERRKREYSTTQLELYARCPFKFFAQRILHISPPPSFDVTLTPLERGVMLHAVLFRLYTELREEGALPLGKENRDKALVRAREITKEEISGIVFDHPYWSLDQERLLGSAEFNGLLEEWIDSDIQRGEEGSALTPMFFEVGFGQGVTRGANVDASLTTSDEMEIHDIKLRGKVDRIEVYERGDEIFYAVADFKTGTPPARADITEGLSLQLMIYLEAVRHILAEHFNVPLENVKPAGGIYYQLRAQHIDVQPKALFVPNDLKKDILKKRSSKYDPDTSDELLNIIDTTISYAEEYVDGIADGVYHVTTHDVNKICRGCEYQAVCRVTEAR